MRDPRAAVEVGQRLTERAIAQRTEPERGANSRVKYVEVRLAIAYRRARKARSLDLPVPGQSRCHFFIPLALPIVLHQGGDVVKFPFLKPSQNNDVRGV